MLRERHDQDTRRVSTSETDGCPECSGSVIEHEASGERACEDCGLVVAEDAIDPGPEWRSFDSSEDRSRVGAPVTNRLHDKGLSTNIGWKNEDASGRQLSSRQRRKLERLRTWNERYKHRTATDRSLKHALGEIERMGSALGLPDHVRETAGVIHRRAQEADVLLGRAIEAVATASLYSATRQARLPRSLSEFTQVSRVGKLRIQRAYRQVSNELGLEDPIGDPKSYVRRYASDLDLAEDIEHIANDLLQVAVEQNRHSGKRPAALAAGAVYAAGRLANEAITQADVSDAADVSILTVRNRYMELLAAKEEGTE